MERSRTWVLLLAMAGLGAAPAAPTSLGVEKTIERIRADWAKPGARPQPNAPGWNALFDRITADLKSYATARSEDDRLLALDRLYRVSVALRGVAWRPAAELDGSLRAWLRPRVSLAWGIRRLRDAVRGLPRANDASVRANRERWLRFTDDQLGDALRSYEGAATVAERRRALGRVYAALDGLDKGNRSRPWVPSLALEAALNDLYNRPNLDASADVDALAPALNTNVVEPEVIFFKGQTSYVTPGPKTGFGLLPSDEGIAFYNSQYSHSVTPIQGFQQQIAADPKGRRAAKLYYFDATTTDNSHVTATTLLTPNGLRVFAPQLSHGADAAIGSTPAPGGGFGRFVASLLGFNQRKITRKVYEGAIGQIRQGVVEGAAELGQIKSSEAEAEKNAQLRQYLVGNNTLRYQNFEIAGLTLRSRPEYALIGGTVKYLNAEQQVGADAPQPAQFETVQPGITADVHLGSIMTNLARGYLQSPAGRGVKNLMIVTSKVPPGAPPQQGIHTTENVDFATFSKAVATAQAANDPKVLAVRIKRPGVAPEFSADSRGFLVALVHDFAIEVPAPAQAARGGLFGPAARIYRLEAPNAEFDISFKVVLSETGVPVRLTGRIEDFDPGPGAGVFAIDQDEEKAARLNAFTSTIVLNAFRTKLRGQPIDVPFGKVNLPNFSIASVSGLDPSGWMRIVLARTGSQPNPIKENTPPAQPSSPIQPAPARPAAGVARR
jgi:hypothetical protein